VIRHDNTPETNGDTSTLELWAHVFGGGRGYFEIWSGTRNANGDILQKSIRSRTFRYPEETSQALAWALERANERREVYFSAHLLNHERRTKENAAPIHALYSDIDGAQVPEDIPQPTCVVESSPGRTQGFWQLDSEVPPEVGEELNRRLAHAIGADSSGWDLSQLLRVPGTPNHKYPGTPTVAVLHMVGESYSPAELDRILPGLEELQRRNGPAVPVSERIPEGKRNGTLTSIAGSMRRRGMDAEEMEAALLAVNERRCDPPLSESEVSGIAYSVSRYDPAPVVRLKGIEGRRNGTAPPKLDPTFICTDTGNSRRFAAKFKGRIIHSRAVGGYAVWDGRRFVRDEKREVVEMAKSLSQDLMHEASKALKAGNTEGAKALSKWAITSCSAPRINATLDLARSEPGIAVHPETLDSHEYFLNVENGTLDLQTMNLLVHDPRHQLTKLAPVVYDAEAAAPTWDAFLQRVLPSEPLRKFVQKLTGLWLSSSQAEQILPLLFGRGANGKSTFVNVLLDLWGDYGQQAAPDLLLAKKNAHPTELAELKGRRFVPSVEVDDGRRLAEALIKQLTGGEKIRARYMRQDFFEFWPEHHVVLVTNHKPLVKGTDHATWRRLKLVPFTVTIPKKEQDPDLPEKLKDERSGILNWALKGYRLWREEGLDEPEEVSKATCAYREEQDVLGAFISECCIVDEKAAVKFKTLYGAYDVWCSESGEQALKKRSFGTHLDERGYESFNGTGNVAMRRGIGLRDDAPDPNRGAMKLAFGKDKVNQRSDIQADEKPEKAPAEEEVNHPHLTPGARVNQRLTTQTSCKAQGSEEGVNYSYPENRLNSLRNSHEGSYENNLNSINSLTQNEEDNGTKTGAVPATPETPLAYDLAPGESGKVAELKAKRELKQLIHEGMGERQAREEVGLCKHDVLGGCWLCNGGTPQTAPKNEDEEDS
jgi:putative DNA primase/helicase